MEREALDRIIRLADDAKPIFHAPDYGVVGTYYVRQPDGTLEEHTATRPPVSAQLRSTESLIAVTHADSATATRTAIYYSDHRIEAALDLDDDLRWSHHLQLQKHPAFAALIDLTRTKAFTQRDLIRFLRATLNGHVDDTIVEEFRALKVATDGETNAVIAKGREAVDKRIQQKILQDTGNAIPDEIIVTVPVYDLDETRDSLYGVTVLVDATSDDNGRVQFELTTVLNSLRQAQAAALREIVENIREHLTSLNADIPIYYGFVTS